MKDTFSVFDCTWKVVDLLGFSRIITIISNVYREWPEKEKKIQRATILRAEVACWRKASAGNNQICSNWQKGNNNWNNHSLQPRHTEEVIWTVQHVETWTKRTIATEEHAEYHSCQIKTRKSGWNLLRITQIGQLKDPENIAGDTISALVLSW